MSKKFPTTINPDKVAEQLLEWSHYPDSTNICHFCANRGITYGTLMNHVKKNEKLAYALEITYMRLADRREKMTNATDMQVKCWDRYQKMYDPFLNDFENKEDERKAKLAKNIAEASPFNLEMLKQMADKIPEKEDFTQK